MRSARSGQRHGGAGVDRVLGSAGWACNVTGPASCMQLSCVPCTWHPVSPLCLPRLPPPRKSVPECGHSQHVLRVRHRDTGCVSRLLAWRWLALKLPSTTRRGSPSCSAPLARRGPFSTLVEWCLCRSRGYAACSATIGGTRPSGIMRQYSRIISPLSADGRPAATLSPCAQLSREAVSLFSVRPLAMRVLPFVKATRWPFVAL